MALRKGFMNKVRKIAETNGCEVTTHRSGSGFRIKSPNGNVLIVHSTPSRPEVYRLSLRDDFRKKLGIDIPKEKW